MGPGSVSHIIKQLYDLRPNLAGNTHGAGLALVARDIPQLGEEAAQILEAADPLAIRRAHRNWCQHYATGSDNQANQNVSAHAGKLAKGAGPRFGMVTGAAVHEAFADGGMVVGSYGNRLRQVPPGVATPAEVDREPIVAEKAHFWTKAEPSRYPLIGIIKDYPSCDKSQGVVYFQDPAPNEATFDRFGNFSHAAGPRVGQPLLDGDYYYHMDGDGRFFILAVVTDDVGRSFNHSTLPGGGPCVCVGGIRYKDGRIQVGGLNRASGHYMPDVEAFHAMLNAFEQRGLYIADDRLDYAW